MAEISLFALVGRTDLRVVARDADDRVYLVEVDQQIGAFHDWLIANRGHLIVTARDQVLPGPTGQTPVKCRAKPESLPNPSRFGGLSLKTERTEALTSVLKDGKLWLVSDKLGPLVREIKDDKHEVRAIRVFDTHRTGGWFKPREPRATGRLRARATWRFFGDCARSPEPGFARSRRTSGCSSQAMSIPLMPSPLDR